MAHSSGGGSSGGGFHGSSSGRHSGNHVYYRHPTPGTKRYAYVDRSGQKRYFYSAVNPAEYKLTSLIMPLMLVLLIVLGNPSFNMGYFVPEKLNHPGEEILIDDGLHAFGEEEQLREMLNLFYEETGVVPAVQTISREEWSRRFTSLEDYAYREYQKLFTDEYHWLIVYSAPVNERGKPDFSQWSFEGMIGDHTGPSVNDPLCYRFTRDTYQNLKAGHAPEEALCRAFGHLLRNRKPGFYTETSLGGSAFLGVLFQWGILLIWPAWEFWTCYEAKVKYRNAVLDQ